MNTERDELETIIAERYHAARPEPTVLDSAIVSAILGAGYRRPRQVTTVEELKALRKNAVIMQPGGTVLVHDGQVEDPWASYAEDPYGGPIWTSSAHVTLPVTVLHEGSL